MPYAEMGRVCVCCVVLCVALRVLSGRGVHPHAISGREVVEGPRKVDSLHTTRFLGYLPAQRVARVNRYPEIYLVTL